MIKKINKSIEGIDLKKYLGQHFLREEKHINTMMNSVNIDNNSKIFEIGCGDGFLTKFLLESNASKILVFEIDQEWADYVKDKYISKKLSVITDNFLDIDLNQYLTDGKWTLIANLPYQITFPIIYKLKASSHLLKEAVIMIQEEVAQKITKTYGRGYGFNSLYLQHYFEWRMLEKILPNAFFPAPKVNSRTIYFKPKENIEKIHQESDFWQFIKRCFSQPRRTLKNNLMSFHYDLSRLSDDILNLRAQQMSKTDLLKAWNILCAYVEDNMKI